MAEHFTINNAIFHLCLSHTTNSSSHINYRDAGMIVEQSVYLRIHGDDVTFVQSFVGQYLVMRYVWRDMCGLDGWT